MYLQGYIPVHSVKQYKRVIATLKDLGYNSMGDTELDLRRILDRCKAAYVYFNNIGYFYVFQSHSVVRYSIKWKRKELLRFTKEHLLKGNQCTCNKALDKGVTK